LQIGELIGRRSQLRLERAWRYPPPISDVVKRACVADEIRQAVIIQAGADPIIVAIADKPVSWHNRE
jgi:hypothetical protein